MSAILGILKVIGILLLILLGILLLLILILLFCPIFYKIAGAREEDIADEGISSNNGTNKPKLWLMLSVKWLLGLLKISYNYPNPGALHVSILGHVIYDSSKASQQKTSAGISQAKEQETAPKQAQTTGKEAEKPTSHVTPDTDEGHTKDATDTEKAKPAAVKPAKSKKSIKEKIKSIYKEFCFYKKFWNAAETQELLKQILFRCRKIFAALLPKKLNARVLVGTGQPDTTGYIMALYGIMLPYLGNTVDVTADFDKQVLEGHFDARGHICIFTLLRHSLAVLLDKNLRIVIRRFKNHKAKIAKETAVSGDTT